jgi:D-glycero-D-manno-heptose 1,7-bisphosphate phosphatase
MKVLFLDKDGTLTQAANPKAFVSNPTDQFLIAGVFDRVAKYVADGFTPIIISNQGGVAYGYKTEADAIEEMRYAMNLLSVDGQSMIREAWFCPSFPDSGGDQCWVVDASIELRPLCLDWDGVEALFRKPNPGMVETAIDLLAEQNHISKEDCLFVGDRPEDQQCAVNAGIPFQWAHDWVAS